MKILKRVLLTVGIIIGLLLVVSLFLPSTYEIKREGTIKAPTDTVFMWVADLKNWNGWSPWNQADPKMKITYSAETIGTGSSMQWASESQGNGKLTIKSLMPPTEATYELDMEGMVSTGKFSLAPDAAGTKLIWSMSGDVGMNPLYKFFIPFMDGMVGPDFEKGINNLQKRASVTASITKTPVHVANTSAKGLPYMVKTDVAVCQVD
ncbi:MAG: SRPBCC family protein [Sphingobacteriales bacterium JAD_PAG50586_3]|nr:MAG: SRPBCC family protein [Sphingobacteriales bacterium JAD_PAG50586_3]